MSESYIYMHDQDTWEENGFIAQAKTSQLVGYLANYTLIESIPSGLSRLKHFRVFAQNFFIEIITRNEPFIKVKNDT